MAKKCVHIFKFFICFTMFKEGNNNNFLNVSIDYVNEMI